jgi:hypothetical protein
MNIQSTRNPMRAQPSKAAKPQPPEKENQVEINSAFSVDRDLTYAVGATLAQVPGAIVGVTGPMYGVPQIAATAIGGIMAASGAKEMMTNDTLHGRINGGIHLAVGAMSAAAPWTGDLASSLYITSVAALGVKALIDQPGNIFLTAASETGSMLGEVFSKWEIDSKTA